MTKETKIMSAVSMTSREIAELTGKRHDHVLRDIRVMIERLSASPDLGWHCETITYIDEQGKPREQYQLDKDTTLTLVTGYDPIPRMKIIKRWQELESQQSQPMTQSEMLVIAAQQLVAIEREQRRQAELQAQLEQRQVTTERRLDQIETASDHFTIIGWWRYAKQNGSLPLPEAARMGKKATAFCTEHAIEMGDVPDPRFGRANTYPKWVLDDLFIEKQQSELIAVH